MLYESLVESLDINNYVYKYEPEDPHFWERAAKFLVERGYYKEGIDLIIEYQKELKRGGYWLPWNYHELENFPEEQYLYYIERLITLLAPGHPDFLEKNVGHLMEFFNLPHQYIHNLTEFSTKFPIFSSEFCDQKINDFKNDLDKGIGAKKWLELSVKFCDTLSNFNLQSLKQLERSTMRCLGFILAKALMVFTVFGEYEKYYDSLLEFDLVLKNNSSNIECAVSAIFHKCIEKQEYKKALKLLNKVILDEPKSFGIYIEIRELKLLYIDVLILAQSFIEAEKEYRELGELRMAAVMYDKAGMAERAAGIRSEMNKQEDDYVQAESTILENICPNPECGKKVEPTWKVCPYCKNALNNVCEKCKRRLKPDWKVCPWCG